jgi:hypothetical protein
VDSVNLIEKGCLLSELSRGSLIPKLFLIQLEKEKKQDKRERERAREREREEFHTS